MIDRRRIGLFLLFAFLISGSAAAFLALNGGLTGGPPGRTLAVLALWYMPGPALAHLLTRLITREGWHNLYLRPHLLWGWPWWLAAWVVPPILIIAGAALYFAFFPGQFDAGLERVQEMLTAAEAQTGQAVPLQPALFVLVQVLSGIVIAPLVNAPASFGEEFGWRAYLLPKLMPLGWRPAMFWTGIIWGVWHWPVLALGYNYGLDYPGAPWLGMLAFVWFTLITGTLFGWLTWRGGSVWPAVIAHGAFNGMANLPSLLVVGDFNPLLGPFAFGLIAGLPLAIVGLWLWLGRPQGAEKSAF